MEKEQKKKISETLKRKFESGKLVCPWEGKVRSKEHSRKLGEANKGKKKSKYWKMKIREANLGNKYNLGRKSMKKGRIYEEIYGEERAKKIKKKMSIKKIGRYSGSKCHLWKGGITPINHYLRTSSMWKVWREAVFLRDNFTCQNKNCKFCNNKLGVFLHPHHVKEFALYPKLRFNVNNGITYCAEHHISSGELHKDILKQKGKVN